MPTLHEILLFKVVLYEKFSILVEKALERRPFSGLAIMTDDKDRISIAEENLVIIQYF